MSASVEVAPAQEMSESENAIALKVVKTKMILFMSRSLHLYVPKFAPLFSLKMHLGSLAAKLSGVSNHWSARRAFRSVVFQIFNQILVD